MTQAQAIGATELLRLGERFAAEDHDLQARLAYERARAAAVATGDRLRAAYALLRQASAEIGLRDLGAARRHLGQVLSEVEPASATPDDAPAFEVPRSAWLLDEGALDPRRTAALARYLEAAVYLDLGYLTSIEEKYAESSARFAAAIELFEGLGCEREAGDAHRMLAITKVKADDPAQATLEFQRAEACYARAEDPVRLAMSRAQSNKLYHDQGLFADAVAVLDDALATLTQRGLPTYWLRYHRAMNLERLGRDDEAFAELERAFDELVTASRFVTAPGMRARWLEGKDSIPSTFLARAWSRGLTDRVHEVMQRAKTSGFVELLGSREVVGARTDEDTPAARAYRDARERLRELDVRLAQGHDPVAASERLDVEAALERLGASLDTRDADLLGTPPLDLDALQAALPPRAVLLDYVLHRDGLGVVIVTSRGRALVRLDRAGRGRDEATRFVEELALRLDELTRAARAALEAGDVAGANHLYEGLGLLEELDEVLLGAPEVQAALDEAEELIVVPHRQLFRVPWCLLRRDGRYLLERLAVSVLPTLAALRAGPARDSLRLSRTSRVLFLVTGSDEVRARLALDEVASALRRFRNVCMVTGGEASSRRLAAEVGQYDLIHFAGHAEFAERSPLLSHLALGAGRTDPAWERLTVRDILQLRLRPSLVILSGCQTARASASRGEELLGLAHAFLVAGARAVIATAWPFEPRVSQALLPALYEGLLAGLSPAHGLRQAQLALLRSEGPLRTPYHWGAFSVTSMIM